MAETQPGTSAGLVKPKGCAPRPLDTRLYLWAAADKVGDESPLPDSTRRWSRAPGRGRILLPARAAPAPAPTLTLVDSLESAREVAVLAITVHFTPERRYRHPSAAAARHLEEDASGGGTTSAPEENVGSSQ